MRIKGVAIGKPGKFKDMNGNTVRFTPEMFSRASRSYAEGDHIPHVHRGHPNSTFMPQQPAIGNVERTYWDGQYFRADYRDVHPWEAQDILSTGRYPNRSMELGINGDDLFLSGVGHLGSSSPAIKGLPHIKPDQCEWMEPTEYGFSEGPAENVICLLSEVESEDIEAMEEEMPESDAKFAALEGKLDSLLSEVNNLKQGNADLTSALENEKASNAQLTQALQDQSRQFEDARFESARKDVATLTSKLHQDGVFSAGHVEADQLNLPAVLLHIRLNCPDIELNGQKVNVFERLQECFELQQELRPAVQQFSQYQRTTQDRQVQSGSKDSEALRLERIKQLKLEHPEKSDLEILQLAEGV